MCVCVCVCVCDDDVMMWSAALHLNAGVHIKQVKHVLHVDERLSDVAVHRPQEVERERQLEQEPVNHHQVSNSHTACGQTLLLAHS